MRLAAEPFKGSATCFSVRFSCFNSKKEFMPIPAGLYEFIGYQTIKWNEMMAASLVGIAPVLIIFIFLQRYIVEGLTAGAVKN